MGGQGCCSGDVSSAKGRRGRQALGAARSPLPDGSSAPESGECSGLQPPCRSWRGARRAQRHPREPWDRGTPAATCPHNRRGCVPPNVTHKGCPAALCRCCFRELLRFPYSDTSSFPSLNSCSSHMLQRILNTDGLMMKGSPCHPMLGTHPLSTRCALGCPAGLGGGAWRDGSTHAFLPSGLFLSQDTVSVHRPSFYAERFFKFMSNTVFRKNSCELPGALGRRGPGGTERG